MFLVKDVLKICSKFTGVHPRRSVISIKLLCNFIEITLQHGCSPVNLLHIFKIPTGGCIFSKYLLATAFDQKDVSDFLVIWLFNVFGTDFIHCSGVSVVHFQHILTLLGKIRVSQRYKIRLRNSILYSE